MTNNGRYPDYPLFKGLQRPLELMGLQGRYIYWAAGVAGGAIVGFIAAYCLMGFVAGLVVLATVLSAGIVLIILKQRKGLHSKNVKRGVYVYAQNTSLSCFLDTFTYCGDVFLRNGTTDYSRFE